MAGAAAWCLGNEDLAVKYWRKGATPAFAVAGANTRTALLLFAASILTPDGSSAERADNLLRKKVNHWRVRNWPGPIAQYIVGEISEEEVREKAVYRTGDPRDRNPKSWQFSFYKLLENCAAADNRIQALESGFKPLLQVKGSEYLEGEKFFYFLRLEEFYLRLDIEEERLIVGVISPLHSSASSDASHRVGITRPSSTSVQSGKRCTPLRSPLPVLRVRRFQVQADPLPAEPVEEVRLLGSAKRRLEKSSMPARLPMPSTMGEAQSIRT